MNYPLGSAPFPGKLQAIAIIQTVIGGLEIIGGVIGGIYVFAIGVLTLGIGFLAIPIPLIFLTIGILSLISGIKGLQRTPGYGLTLGVAISQMVLLLMCDFASFGCGLASLILLLQDEVKAYFGK